MLIEFSVENFRSFREKKTLSMVASKRITGGEDEHLIDIPGTDEKLLRVAAIYGANGSGKSNLVKAMQFAIERIVQGTKPNEKIPYQPFRFNKETIEAPTTFSFLFIAADSAFEYSFTYDSDSVHSEEMNQISGEKRHSIFRRIQSENGKAQIKFGREFGKNATETIKALKTVGARPNQLFLTEIININDSEQQGKLLHSAVRWLLGSNEVLDTKWSITGFIEVLKENPEFFKFASAYLQIVDNGIRELVLLRRERQSLGIPTLVREMIEMRLPAVNNAIYKMGDNAEIVDSGSGDYMQYFTAAIHATQSEESIPLSLSEESNGTQRLVELLFPLFKMKADRGILIIDELERSLHSLLAYRFVEYFLKSSEHTNGQLIFTTHSTHLLDLELLRRDEIWFTEKDSGGGTHLYPLSDFKPRKDLAIDKGYLQGRFGAVPYLAGFDQLIEREKHTGAK